MDIDLLKEEEDRRKIAIARRILAQNEEKVRKMEEEAAKASAEQEARDSEKKFWKGRYTRTHFVIADPKSDATYSMDQERQMIADERMQSVLWELDRHSKRETTIKQLVNIVRRTMEGCLFGCSVNIGICRDSANSVLEFPAIGDNSAYPRREIRGKSILFECLDQKDIVVQAHLNTGKHSSHQQSPSPNRSNSPNKSTSPTRPPSAPYLESGETVVHVPLLSRGGGVGVMEIHGLQTEGLSIMSKFERDNSALMSMIKNKDYSFVNSFLFYRRPEMRSGGIIKSKNDFNKSNYNIVNGRVVSVQMDRNGVPFFGGPRYNILWEDGMYEEAVPASSLLKAYKHTAQSLGTSTVLDEELCEQLLKLGAKIGDVVEGQRRKDGLTQLKEKIFKPGILDSDILERSMKSILEMIRGIREVGFLGYQEQIVRTDIDPDNEDNAPETERPTSSGPTAVYKSDSPSRNNNPLNSRSKDKDREEDDLIPPTKVKERTEIIQTFKPLFLEGKDLKSNINGPTFFSRFRKHAKSMRSSFTSSRGSPGRRNRSLSSGSNGETEKDNTFFGPFSLPDNKFEWIGIRLNVPAEFRYKKVHRQQYFVYIIRLVGGSSKNHAALDFDLFEAAVKLLEDSLNALWEKDMRKVDRKKMLKDMEVALNDWKDLPAQEIAFKALTKASVIVPGASLYVGMLGKGGDVINYIASTINSRMSGKKLNRGQGVSFDVMERKELVVLSDKDSDKSKSLHEGSRVDVSYGKLYYKATIVKCHGHQLYDVMYEKATFGGHNSAALMSRYEASVHLDRITPLNSVHRVKKFGYTILPFVCVPVRNREKGIGVIGVDNFSQVAVAPYDEHPDENLVQFLEQFGKSLGGYLDLQRKKAFLGQLAHINKNINATHHDVFDVAFDVVQSNLNYVTGITAVQIIYEDNVPEEERGVRFIHKCGRPAQSTMTSLEEYDPSTMSLKAVQKRSDTCVWLVLRLRSEIRGGQGKLFVFVVEQNPLENKSVRGILAARDRQRKEEDDQNRRVAQLKFKMAKQQAEKQGMDQEQALKVAKRAAELAIKAQEKEQDVVHDDDHSRFEFLDPDMEYLEQVQKILLGCIQNVDVRKAKDLIRFEALRDIKEICSDWPSLAREDLFAEVMEQIRSCYFSASIYVGMLSVRNKQIEYSLVSDNSRMGGKILSRSHRKGVTFLAFDENRIVAVPHIGHPLASQLHHFGKAERFEYPYIVIPLVAYLNSPMAVLCADATFEISMSAEDSDAGEAVSFLNTVGAYLADAVRGYKLKDAYADLEKIIQKGENFRVALRQVKKVVMSMVPYADRICELVFEPHPVDMKRDYILEQQEKKRGRRAANIVIPDDFGLVKENLAVLIRILRSVCYISKAKNPTIQVIWQDKVVFEGKFESHVRNRPIILDVPVGAPIERVSLLLIMKAQMGALSKEIAREKIGLQYLVSAPATMVDHHLLNSQFEEYRCGTISFACKSYAMTDAIAFVLTNVSLKSLIRPSSDGTTSDDASTMKIFVILRWRGVDIYRSDIIESNNPVINGIKVEAEIVEDSFETDELSIEVWEEFDMTTESTLIGNLTVHGKDIHGELGRDTGNMTGARSKPTASMWYGIDQRIPVDPLEIAEQEAAGVQDPEKFTTRIGGRLRYSGYLLRVSQIGPADAEKLFRQQLLRATGEEKAPGQGDDDESEMVDRRVYHECELTIMAGRDLYSLVDDSARIDPFVIVYFNGEEIGRTGYKKKNRSPKWSDEVFIVKAPGGGELSTSSLVLEVWSVPSSAKGEMLGSVNITGKALVSFLCSPSMKVKWFDVEQPLYTSETYANIVNYGLESLSDQRSYNEKLLPPLIGELMLSGRTMTIEADDEAAKELGKLELSLIDFNIKKLMTYLGKVDDDTLLFATIHFNGREVYRSEPSPAPSWPIYSSGAFQTVLRVPCDRTLFQSVLRINIWRQSNTIESLKLKVRKKEKETYYYDSNDSRLLAFCDLTSTDLQSLIGSDGCRTQWKPLKRAKKVAGVNDDKNKKSGKGDESEEESDDEDEGRPGTPDDGVLGEVKLRAGPLHGEDIIEFDGREIHLDVMSLQGLPKVKFMTKSSTRLMVKPSPYAVIYWNGKELGRSTPVVNTCNPVWTHQRYTLRTPLMANEKNSLKKCKLRVEIWNRPTPLSPDVLVTLRDPRMMDQDMFMGCVEIEGQKLVGFAGLDVAPVRWFDLSDPGNQSLMYVEGRLKLRAGTAGSPDDPKTGTKDYILILDRARDLGKADELASSNPYANISLDDDILGKSDTVSGTADPVWTEGYEEYLVSLDVKDNLGKHKVNVEIWDKNQVHGSDDFLGRVQLEDKRLNDLLDPFWYKSFATIADMRKREGKEQYEEQKEFVTEEEQRERENEFSLQTIEFPLEINPNYTKLENALVQGHLTLKGKKVEVLEFSEIVTVYDTAILNIAAASDLARADLFGKSDPFCVVHWCSTNVESGKFFEIGSTHVVTQNLNPVWKNEMFKIQVPWNKGSESREFLSREWDAITVRIDCWDMDKDVRGEFLGSVILKGAELENLLNRTGEAVANRMEYDFTTNDILPKSQQKLVRGKLILKGGREFDWNNFSTMDNTSVVPPQATVNTNDLSDEENDGDVDEEDDDANPLLADLEFGDEDNENSIMDVPITPDMDTPLDDIGCEFVLDVRSAINLARIDRFSSTSSYCVVTWQDEALGRTVIAPGTQNPRWATVDPEGKIDRTDSLGREKAVSWRVVLPKRLGERVADCTLNVSCYGRASSSNLPDSPRNMSDPRDHFLGQVEINGIDLLKAIYRPESTFGGSGGANNPLLSADADDDSDYGYEDKEETEEETFQNALQDTARYGIFKPNDAARPSVRSPSSKLIRGSTSRDGFSPPNSTKIRGRSSSGGGSFDDQDSSLIVSHNSDKASSKGSNKIARSSSKGSMRMSNFKISFSGKNNVDSDCTTFRLEAPDDLPKNKRKKVGGELRLACNIRMLTREQVKQEIPEGHRAMFVTLTKALGLPKPSAFANPNPFYIVRWDGVEVGRSQVVNGSANPQFFEETFQIVVPKTKRNLGPGFEGDEHSLAVDIWSYAKSGKHDFLGGMYFTGKELESLVTFGVQRRWVTLDGGEHIEPGDSKEEKEEHKRRMKGVVRAKGDARLLVLTSKSHQAGFDGKEIEINVCAACNLGRADSFGLSDPYVQVYWNDKMVGQTTTINNTLDPIWDDEKFIVKIPHGWDINECELYMEVYDYNVTTTGVFLGSIELTNKALKEWISDGKYKRTSFPLTETKNLPSHLQTLVQGSLVLKGRFLDDDKQLNEDMIKMQVRVHSASNLAKADTFGLSDPFVIVRFNDREIGRTEVIDNDLNPVWENEKFNIFLEKGEDMENATLEFLCYDMDMIGKGDFLGCVELKGEELAKFFGIYKKKEVETDTKIEENINTDNDVTLRSHLDEDDAFNTSDMEREEDADDVVAEGSEDGDELIHSTVASDIIKGSVPSKFELSKTEKIHNSKQSLVQGLLEISARHAKVVRGLEGGAVRVEWMSLLEKSAGAPLLSITPIAAHNIPTVANTLLGPQLVYCVVMWGEEEIARTDPAGGSPDPIFDHRAISIVLQQMDETLDTMLSLQVYEHSANTFLGCVNLTYWSIISIHEGQLTLTLEPRNHHDIVSGLVSLHLKITYPFWDTKMTHVPLLFERRIVVLGASDLPEINELMPSTKCVVYINEHPKARSMLQTNTCDPIWAHTECAVVVSPIKPLDVQIHIFHIDPSDRKEICIGIAHVPFEFLLRPTNEVTKIYLGPPSNRIPLRKYKFNLGGMLKLRILSEDAGSYSRPWAAHQESPPSATSTRDVCLYLGGKLGYVDGPELKSREKLWLGTAVDLGNVAKLSSRPEWVMLPLSDVSMKICGVTVGSTKPGERFVMALQRQLSHCYDSDISLLRDMRESVQSSIIRIRMTDFRRKIRAITLERLKQELSQPPPVPAQTNVEQSVLDMQHVTQIVARNVSLCFPGCTVLVGTVRRDYMSLELSVYTAETRCQYLKEYTEAHESIRDSVLFSPSKRIPVERGQGSEWSCVTRNSRAKVIKSTEDMEDWILFSTQPFKHTGLPRVIAPLRSDDVSLGYIIIEKLEAYCTGAGRQLYEAKEIRDWLEQIGVVSGDIMYALAAERAALRIDHYVNSWISTHEGLVSEILACCSDVLKGVKLLEIWSTSKDFRITSLSQYYPTSVPPSGRKVTIKRIIVNEKAKPPTPITQDNLDNLPATAVQPKKEDDSIHDGSTTSLLLESQSLSSLISHDSIAHAFKCEAKLLGISYMGCEQTVMLRQISTADSTFPTYETAGPVDLYVSNDRDIKLNLYDVDKNLATGEDSHGKLQLLSFDEKELKCTLGGGMMSILSSTLTECVADLEWANDGEESTPTGGTKANKILKFELTIVKAFGLKQTDIAGLTDPFVEVYWKGTKELIAKTKVIDDTLTPTWEETFTFQNTFDVRDNERTLCMEAYDMNMFGKGSFLGMAEIPYKTLCLPPANDVEMPLVIKTGLATKKQKYVGGSIVIRYAVETEETDELEQELAGLTGAGDAAQAAATTIPSMIFSLDRPAVYVTMDSASSLMKADTFGQSDPFAMIYVDESRDPLFRTKVINRNLNPIWDETYAVTLGAALDRETSTADDLPTIRVAVFDMDTLGPGDFLGQVIVPPTIYLHRKRVDLALNIDPKIPESKNKLVGGRIVLKFALKDVNDDHEGKSFVFSPERTLMSVNLLDVSILGATNLMKADRFGLSDPYVEVFWGNESIGKTPSRQNTLNPKWHGQSFTVNLSNSGARVRELVLQVWDQDFFTSGTFMGEVRISGDTLLHPPIDVQNIEVQNIDGKVKGKIEGKLSFQLSMRVKPQYPDLLPSEVTNRSHKPQPLEPLEMTTLKDPEEEVRRQAFEGSSFPNLVKRAKDEMELYEQQSFERSGRISELHFGQAKFSYQRSMNTVLKTQAADMLLVPTGFTAEKDPELLSILARYPSGQLPRRDVNFLNGVKSILVKGMSTVAARGVRQQQRSSTISNLTIASGALDHPGDVLAQALMDFEQSLGNGVVVDMFQLCVEIEDVKECPLLSSDNKHWSTRCVRKFRRCARDTGLPLSDEQLKEAEASNNSVNSGGKGIKDVQRLLPIASKVCRHGIILQNYRAEQTVFGIWWEEIHQTLGVALPSLEDTLNRMERNHLSITDIEPESMGPIGVIDTNASSLGSKAVKEIGTLMRRGAMAKGVLMVPVMAHNEMLLGVLCVRNADKIAHAVYSLKSRNKVKSSADGNGESNIEVSDVVEVEAPEDGVIQMLAEGCQLLANGIVSARLGSISKRLKSFPLAPSLRPAHLIHPNGSPIPLPLLALRAFMRGLVESLPSVIEVSVWAVDLDRKVRIIKDDAIKPKANWLTRLFGSKNKKDSEEGGSKTKVKGKKGWGALEEHPDAFIGGYFGGEDPAYMMGTAKESKLKPGGYTEEQLTGEPERPGYIPFETRVPSCMQIPEKKDPNMDGPGLPGLDPAQHGALLGVNTKSRQRFPQEDLVDMVHAEVIRCLKDNTRNFRVTSGHVLFSIADEEQSEKLIKKLFNGPNEGKFFKDEDFMDFPEEEIKLTKEEKEEKEQLERRSERRTAAQSMFLGSGKSSGKSSSFPQPPSSPVASGRGGRPRNAPLPPIGGPPSPSARRSGVLSSRSSEVSAINPDLGKNRKYYLAVKASGTGGDTGWGNIGDGIQTAITKFVAGLDPLLVKINLAYEALMEEMMKEKEAEKEAENMMESVIDEVDNESSIMTTENSLEITDVDGDVDTEGADDEFLIEEENDENNN